VSKHGTGSDYSRVQADLILLACLKQKKVFSKE